MFEVKLTLYKDVLKDYSDVIGKYPDSVTKYCVDVISGHILAGRLIKLACYRQLRDLRRIGDKDFPFDYSSEAVEMIIDFAEFIPDVSTGQKITLASFQKFIFGMIQGWKDIRTGGARFKRILVSMARTNGKTQIASVLALRDFLFGYPNQSRQIVVSSNNMSHVRQLYDYIRLSLHKLEETDDFEAIKPEIIDNSQEIRIESINTKLMQMSADSIGADSIHPTLAIFDEWHKQKTTDFIDSLTSGNVQNPDARLILISTAGTDPNVPMFDDYRRYTTMLEEDDHSLDDNLFLCWEQDNDDEAYQPDMWIKSNPLMELPEMAENLKLGNLSERENQVSAGNLPKFLVKNMNRWQNAKENAYLPLDVLQGAIIPEDDFELYDRPVYVGYDASMVNDNTALAFIFPYTDKNGVQKWHLYQHSFVPWKHAGTIEAKEKRDGINYHDAERRGFATITRERFGMVNQGEVFEWLMNFILDHRLDVKAVAYDAWGTGEFIRTLEENRQDWLLIPIRQGTHSLSEPTKWLQDRFTDRHITRFDDKAMEVAFNNAILTSDNNGIKIDKNKNSAKIDIVDAVVDATFEAMFYYSDFTNIETKEDKHNPFKGWQNEKINDYFKSSNFGF